VRDTWDILSRSVAHIIVTPISIAGASYAFFLFCVNVAADAVTFASIFGTGYLSRSVLWVITLVTTSFLPANWLWLGPAVWFFGAIGSLKVVHGMFTTFFRIRKWLWHKTDKTTQTAIISSASAVLSTVGVISLGYVTVKSFMILWSKIVEERKKRYEATFEPEFESKGTPDSFFKMLQQGQIWLTWFNSTAEMVRRLETFKDLNVNLSVLAHAARNFQNFVPRKQNEAAGDFTVGCSNCNQLLPMCNCRACCPNIYEETELNLLPVTIDRALRDTNIITSHKATSTRVQRVVTGTDESGNDIRSLAYQFNCRDCNKWHTITEYKTWFCPKDHPCHYALINGLQDLAKRDMRCIECAWPDLAEPAKCATADNFSPVGILEKAKHLLEGIVGENVWEGDLNIDAKKAAYYAIMTAIGATSIALIYKSEKLQDLAGSLKQGAQSWKDKAGSIYDGCVLGAAETKQHFFEWVDPRPKISEAPKESPESFTEREIKIISRIADLEEKLESLPASLDGKFDELKSTMETFFRNNAGPAVRMLAAANLMEPNPPESENKPRGFERLDPEHRCLESAPNPKKEGKGGRGKTTFEKDSSGKNVAKTPKLGQVQPGFSAPKKSPLGKALTLMKMDRVRTNYFSDHKKHNSLQFDQYFDQCYKAYGKNFDPQFYIDRYPDEFAIWGITSGHDLGSEFEDWIYENGYYTIVDEEIQDLEEEWNQIDEREWEDEKDRYLALANDSRTHLVHGYEDYEDQYEAKGAKASLQKNLKDLSYEAQLIKEDIERNLLAALNPQHANIAKMYSQHESKCSKSCPGKRKVGGSNILTCPCNPCAKCGAVPILHEQTISVKGVEHKQRYYKCPKGCKPSDCFPKPCGETHLRVVLENNVRKAIDQTPKASKEAKGPVAQEAPAQKPTKLVFREKEYPFSNRGRDDSKTSLPINGKGKEEEPSKSTSPSHEAAMSGNPAMNLVAMTNTNNRHQVPLKGSDGSIECWGSLIRTKVEGVDLTALVHNHHAYEYGVRLYGDEGYIFNPEHTCQLNDSDWAITLIDQKQIPQGVALTKFSVAPDKKCRWYMFPRRDGIDTVTHYDGWEVDKFSPTKFLHKGSTDRGDCGRRIITVNNEVIGIHSGTHGKDIENYFLGVTPDVISWLLEPIKMTPQ